MLNIETKTTHEKMCLRQCMEAKKYAPTLTDEHLKHMYDHLMKDPANKMTIANDTISFEDAAGNTIKAECITADGPRSMSIVVLSSVFFKALTPSLVLTSEVYDRRCSNNNNNNNNNNNY